MTTEAQAPGDKKPRKVARERLDVLVAQRALAPSRERARALILAGEVRVDGRISTKAGVMAPVDAAIELVGPADELRFVSRGGLKLERALDAFHLDPTGSICLDIGASTGGFTDVLLRRGAARVYAVDVGHGQLAWSLRNDPRVVVMERTNIRHLQSLPEPVDCVVIDVSFISLRLVLPRVAALAREGAWGVALVKPQFEAGRAEADRGAGVISDPAIHLRVLRELVDWLGQAQNEGDQRRLYPQGLIASPITGREGNAEYLLKFNVSSAPAGAPAIDDACVGAQEIEAAVAAAFSKAL